MNETTMELAHLMKANPGGIEKDLSSMGAKLVGLFQDENYTDRRFADLTPQKIELLKKAIEDISAGVMILRSSTMGLAYRNNKISPYVSPHGTLPSGTVIYSITWKNIAAFKAWRFGDGDDIPEEEVNAAIYFLTTEISHLLK